MSLLKQLNIFIVVLFFMVFTGNFIISIQNTKEFLISESVSKAQDTATSLGLTLKPLMKDKKDPEIIATIKAVADRGFFKEIRLENIGFSFSNIELLEASKDIEGLYWSVSNISIDPQLGELVSKADDAAIGAQLAQLENDTQQAFEQTQEIKDDTHLFIASDKLKENDLLTISFTATNNNNQVIQTQVQLPYTKILFVDNRPVKFDTVPQWFIDLITIDLPETKSEIVAGWNTTAIIYVSANPGDAYAKLYNQVKSAVIYSVVAFALSIVFAFVFVNFILRPLRKIESLAKEITKGNFSTIKELPWTTELKSVSLAINDMSAKIEGVIKKLNKNLENATKKLSIDDVTGLSIKQSFETDMKNIFMHKTSGYLFSVKIDNLAEFAKEHGNNEVDNFLKSFADILVKCDANVSAYRFYGSEFAMIAKNVTYEQAVKISDKLQVELDKLSQKINKQNIAHIGAAPINQFGTINEMLASANAAYEKAKQVGPNEAVITDETELTKDMTEWKELVFDIIDNGKFTIEYINDALALNDETNKILMQEAFTKVLDNSGKLIPIGTFISIAEKYEKIITLDEKVVTKVISHIKAENIDHEISVNLSLDSISNTDFRLWLKELLLSEKDIASKLVFSITSYGVSKDMQHFKEFAKQVHDCGSKVIIKRFETKFVSLDDIKQLQLDYVRLARDYTNGIAKDNTKKGFVESMQDLSELLNIKVFAENVKDDQDLAVVKSLGLYGASR